MPSLEFSVYVLRLALSEDIGIVLSDPRNIKLEYGCHFHKSLPAVLGQKNEIEENSAD